MAAKSSTSRKKTASKKSAPKKPAARPKPKAKPATPAAKAAGPARAVRSAAAKPAAPRAAAKAPATRPSARRPEPAATPAPPPEPEVAAKPEPAARVPRGLREPRAHPDASLTKVQVKRLHQRLIEERSSVLNEIRRSVQGAVEEVPVFTESIDQAQHETEQNFRLRLADKQRKLLNEIQAALLKLEEGDYGICEGTEEPIGYARLEVRPWARYSVEYKEMKDRRER